MAQLAVEISGDERRLLQAIANVNRKLEETEQGMKRAQRASKDASDTNEHTFGAMALTKLTSYVTALAGPAGLTAALGLAKREMEGLIALQAKMHEEQLTVAASQDMLKRNFSGSNDELRKLLQTAQGIAGETGVGQEVINAALADAISASGGNVPEAVRAVRMAAQYNASAPEAIPTFAGAMLDMAKATGFEDTVANFGFMRKVGELGRVVDPELQAKNIPRAIVGATIQGATSQEAAALFASLGNFGADPLGARTGTAVIALTQQLTQFFDEDSKAKRTGAETTTEQIQALQNNTMLFQRFMEAASFEKVMIGPIQALLSDQNSKASTMFADFSTKIGTEEQLAAGGREALERLDVGVLAAGARTERETAETLQKIMLADEEASMKTIARERVPEALEATQGKFRTSLFRLGTMAREFMGGDVGEISERALQQEINRLTATQTFERAMGPGAVPSGPRERVPTAAELESAALLQEMLDELRAGNEAQLAEAQAMNEILSREKQVDRNSGDE